MIAGYEAIGVVHFRDRPLRRRLVRGGLVYDPWAHSDRPHLFLGDPLLEVGVSASAIATTTQAKRPGNRRPSATGILCCSEFRYSATSRSVINSDSSGLAFGSGSGLGKRAGRGLSCPFAGSPESRSELAPVGRPRRLRAIAASCCLGNIAAVGAEPPPGSRLPAFARIRWQTR